jgi:4-amino-4-deoxy-L-arabinose transferase-like glycosyltransferase
VSRERALALLLPPLLALALVLPGIGRADFQHEDEWRNGVMVREMAAAGFTLHPTLHGERYPDYPPLYFWLASGVARLEAGSDPSPFALRWPAALGAALVAFGTALAGLRLGSVRLGRRAGLLAAVLPGLVLEERRAMIDPLLAGLTTVSVALLASSGTEAEESPNVRARRFALGALALALGWLTKGPLAAVVVGLALAGGEGMRLLLGVSREPADFGRLGRRAAALGGVVLLVAALWFGAAFVLGGRDFGWNLLETQTYGRFAEIEQHKKPWHYFAWSSLPALLPVGLFALEGAWLQRFVRARSRAGAFALGWFVLVLVFFSLSKTKRSYYLMPAYPAVALLAACAYERVSEMPGWARGALRGSHVALFALLAVAAAVAPLGALAEPRLAGPLETFTLAAVLGAVAFAALAWRDRLALALVAGSAFVLAGVSAALPETLAALGQHHGHHALAEKVLAAGVPKEAIALARGGLHREALCWELAPDARHGLPHLTEEKGKPDHADPVSVGEFLGKFPPGKAAVILARRDLVAELDPTLHSELEVVAEDEGEASELVALARRR